MAYDSLTTGQKKVAEFALTRGAEVIYLPAGRIADLVGVSHSTVVRTAQALGFRGFPEFQTALQEQFRGRMSTLERFQFGSGQLVVETAESQRDNYGSVLHQVMLADVAHIEHVVRKIPVEDFERAVDLLHTAAHVFVVGLRASAPLALSFAHGLRHLRPGCVLLQQGMGDLPDHLREIASDDLLVAMSYGRYTRDTLRCMEYARRVGAHVLTVTDSTLSPAAKRSDIALVVPIRLWFNVMSAAPLSVTSALLIALALRHKDGTRERLGHLDDLLQQFQVFESQAGPDVLSQIEQME